jgi:hypothetical protein
MSVSTHATGHWAAAHRTALFVLLVAAAIAAALTLVAVRLVDSAVPVPPGSTTSQHLAPTDDTCANARSGQPC